MTRGSKRRYVSSACLSIALALPLTALAQAPVGDLVTPDATVRGAVQSVATGTRVMSGSSVSAGSNTAALRLLRGGEVRVCPRTTVSFALSPSGRDLAISLGTGGMETHYRLRSSADTVMTPDFRILLAGPGSFDYAIMSDMRGNTCIRSLSSSGASIVVSEIMGDGTYQLTPGDQVYFSRGSVANATNKVPPDCGCPPPVATMNANTPETPAPAPVPVPPPTAATPTPTTPKPPVAQPTQVPANSPEAVFAEHGRAVPTPQPAPSATTNAPSANATPPKPPDSEVHVQVDAPFVFSGAEEAKKIPPPPQIAHLRLVYLPKLIAETQDTTVRPPARAEKPHTQKESRTDQPKQPSKGFFGHLKSFFGGIFK